MQPRVHALLVLGLVLAACRSSPTAAPMKAAGNGVPPNGVFVCDGITGSCSVLGIDGNPFAVKIVSGSLGDGGVQTITGTIGVYQADGGGVANSWSVQLNDGTNVLGTGAHPVPGDPTAGDLLNVTVSQVVPVSSALLIDAGTRSFVETTVTNEGTLNGWWQLYCGQLAIDAGGTADAGTAPTLQIRCPAGQVCGIRAPLSCGVGATWYASSTAGLLTVDAGVPNMTAITAIR